MSVFYITFRSVTPAQRGERLLQKSGHGCSLQRTPRWMEEKGCGYCLRLWGDDIGTCISLLRGSQVPFRKVYRQDQDGKFEEVTL